jgi:formylglycine-generating enzyme
MGTDYESGFPADGEGPVRSVPFRLRPFAVDTFPVTNADFAVFIAATQYRAEAEVFGWSFVFWAHIPAQRFGELVEDTARCRAIRATPRSAGVMMIRCT